MLSDAQLHDVTTPSGFERSHRANAAIPAYTGTPKAPQTRFPTSVGPATIQFREYASATGVSQLSLPRLPRVAQPARLNTITATNTLTGGITFDPAQRPGGSAAAPRAVPCQSRLAGVFRKNRGPLSSRIASAPAASPLSEESH